MKAPRVVINYDLAPHGQWCWRPEWYSGSDSAYSLLAKFSRLNVLTVREVCEVFVEPNLKAGEKYVPGSSHYPRVDLRFSKHLSIGRLANILKVDPACLQSAFIDTMFPTAAHGAASYLKWCGTCAAGGFHSAVFQLDFVHSCPIHKTALRRRCSKCGFQLPYHLYATEGGTLFCCPHCRTDVAPSLSKLTRSPTIPKKTAAAFASHVDMIRFVDQLPTLIEKCRAAAGSPYLPVVLSKPDIHHRVRSFRHFVTNVLSAVSRGGQFGAQLEIELFKPISIFRDPTPLKHGVKPGKRVKTSPRESVAKNTDRRLQEATEIYKAIRRHLWRHHVCKHRVCAHHAMKALWWDLHGEKTNAFCSTALAFVRWRMQWEGRRVPSRMIASQHHGSIAYGLLSWVSTDAPIPSVHWSQQFESWLNAHILAAACFDSFRGWLHLSAADELKNEILWESGGENGYAHRHWACSGRGSSSEPGLFFLEPMNVPESAPFDFVPFNRKHFQELQTVVKSLKR